MTYDLYLMPASAPCRTVLMVAKELNIPLNLKELDLMKGEHMKPEFLAINPQHTIPTLHDPESGLALWESRAIATFLVNKHAPGHDLYPADPAARALVDQRLHFDLGTLYPAIGKVVYAPLFWGKEVADEDVTALATKLTFLDGFLANSKYVAGAKMTVADLSIHSSLHMCDVADNDLSPYPNIVAWRKVMAQLPYDTEINVGPVTGFKAWALAAKAAKAQA